MDSTTNRCKACDEPSILLFCSSCRKAFGQDAPEVFAAGDGEEPLRFEPPPAEIVELMQGPITYPRPFSWSRAAAQVALLIFILALLAHYLTPSLALNAFN